MDTAIETTLQPNDEIWIKASISQVTRIQSHLGQKIIFQVSIPYGFRPGDYQAIQSKNLQNLIDAGLVEVRKEK